MSLLGVKHRRRPVIIVAGLLGAALIYGDGAITPAISVLSALEGLDIAAPELNHYVVPAAVVILLALFAVQPLGTSRIGAAFGPIMVIWFVVIGALGLWGIAQDPWVLQAINPYYGVQLLVTNGFSGFLVLGGIFLCVTGAEALYADMGHFGKGPIRIAWSWVVFPCLVLNYAGQCAIALRGESIENNIFYRLCPEPLLIAAGLPGHGGHDHRQPIDHHRRFFHDPAGDPARLAAAPAYQADLGKRLRPNLCRRRQLAADGRHHHADGAVPQIRRSRRGLRHCRVADDAHDILPPVHCHARDVAMAARDQHRRCRPVRRRRCRIFRGELGEDSRGGYVPLLLASIVYGLMLIWHRGSAAVAHRLEQAPVSVSEFLADLKARSVPRVPGTAVFLTRTGSGVPPVMIWHLRHNRALHERVVVLRVLTESRPRVIWPERMSVEQEGEGFWRVTAHFGFMQRPDIPLF